MNQNEHVSMNEIDSRASVTEKSIKSFKVSSSEAAFSINAHSTYVAEIRHKTAVYSLRTFNIF